MEPAGASTSKTTKVNAFQLLMSSQKKSLGTNCDGKKSLSLEEPTGEDAQKKARKNALKKWADEKGAAKRKRDYVARGEVIDFKLEERSKRLKCMLKIQNQNNEEIVQLDAKESTNKTKNEKDSEKSSRLTEKKKDNRCEEQKQIVDSSSEQEIENENLDSEQDSDEKMGASFTNKTWKMRIKLKLSDDFNGSKPSSVDEQSVLTLALKFGDVEHKKTEAEDLDNIETSTDDDVEEVVNDDLNVRSRRPKPAIIVSSDDSSNENDEGEGEPRENGSIHSQPTIVVLSDEQNSQDEPGKNSSSTGRVLRPRRSKPAILIESSDEECVLNSSKIKKTTREKPKIIAPIFHRSQQPDPQVVEARRAFLLSGMPDRMQQKVDTERLVGDPSSERTEFHLEYPKITSVPQAASIYPKVDLNLPPFEPLPKPSALPPCENCLVLRAQNPIRTVQGSHKTTTVDRDVELAILKESNPDLPVDRFYQYAKRMHKNGDSTQIWTDKYRARKVKHLFKNYDSIVLLRDWMKNFDDRKKRCDSSNNSGSDFVVSDDDDGVCGGGLTGNSVVLSGPSGCGKSNTLYAICADLGLDVLEINASSKRTGKWLLHELQEATQSHQLNKKDNKQSGNTLANNGWLKSTASAAAAKREEQEKAKNAKQKMCVLFVEDVDIIFDQDDGFVAALKEIIYNSKRPVVMTTTDEDSPNVKKLMWKSVQLEPASVKTLSVWLKVICIMEELDADLETLAELLTFNKRDLRRTLLDLQTCAHPAATSNSLKRIENLELLYWNFPAILRTDDDDDDGENEKSKLQKLCDLYDAVIMADGISKSRHESLERPGFRYPKDSLVLEENTESYSDRAFDEELARSLIASGLRHYRGAEVDLRAIGDEAAGLRAKRKSMDLLLDKVVRPGASRAAKNLDYMACLCAIAKSEKKRAAASRSKRRFDHFFSSHLDLNRQNNWDSIGDILNKKQ